MDLPMPLGIPLKLWDGNVGTMDGLFISVVSASIGWIPLSVTLVDVLIDVGHSLFVSN